MLQSWIESLFIKRFLLSLATGSAAYVAAHSLPGLAHLAAAGISVTVQIDPTKLADYLGVAVMAGTQGLHEYLAAKYPELGKYI